MTSIFPDKENHTIGHAGLPRAAPKTPFTKRAGNARTPFASKANENNFTYHAGKLSVTDGETIFKSPFKTPNEKRIPLGGKDTNFRTVQTKPQKSVVKSTSGRRRAKLTIKPEITKHLSVSAIESIGEDFADIEYMPPRAKDLPFIPDDYEPLDRKTLRDILNDGGIIADYHYPRDSEGMTSMERKVNGIFDNLDNEYIPNDLDFMASDEAGLRDFEKPLALEVDAEQCEVIGLQIDDDFSI
ncbi:hypothetical protein V1525DRAFT_383607 [Lipomyces kononenkoae]|uniref:Uncharacterized protein n=1 Tax=Lipomyces kononenkoae TaxID=34357 RepID=A0ACC3SSE5_LIPKO